MADFAYGTDHERQKFDFWQAKSDKPTPLVLLIHGGGWVNGDKRGYGAKTIEPFLNLLDTINRLVPTFDQAG